MGQVVEAFRFLSARVQTLEARLAVEDQPVDGPAWLVPARELGPWAGPVAAHVLAATPGGELVHADCGEGALLDAFAGRGAVAHGVEPRGAVALRALERGCSVTIAEASEYLSGRPDDTLGGIVLSGMVDRLPLHELLPLLDQCRRTLARDAPLVVLSEAPGGGRTTRGAGAGSRRGPFAARGDVGAPLDACGLRRGRPAPGARERGAGPALRPLRRHALVSGIHHFVPVLHRGDAVGRHTLRLRDTCRAHGFDSDIYVDTVEADTESETAAGLVLPGGGAAGRHRRVPVRHGVGDGAVAGLPRPRRSS